MVPPVRSRAARFAVPPGVSAETPAIKRGLRGAFRFPRKTGFAGSPGHWIGSGRPPLRTPTAPCLPCVRGGAERMRSGGVVGMVQEKVSCNRNPRSYTKPTTPQSGPAALPAPLFDRGRFCGNAGRHRSAGRARSDGRNHVSPVNPLLFRRGTGDEGTRSLPSPLASPV